MSRRLALAALFGLASTSLAPAVARAQGAPGTISFKARLGDNGTPVSGSHDFLFRIYDAASGGALLWEEPETALVVDAGLVVHELGKTTALAPAVAAGTKVFLEIRMDQVLMEPRVAIASVPFALSARDAKTLAGNAPTAFATAGHNHNSTYVNVTGDAMSGDLDVSANINLTGKVRSDAGGTMNEIAIGHAPFGNAGFAYETIQLPASRNLRFAFGDTTAGQEDMVLTNTAQLLMQSRAGDCPDGWFCNGHFWDISSASMFANEFRVRSDRRLKKNITPLPEGLRLISALRPVTYEWKDARRKGVHYGFIAQEVEEVLPEIVLETDHGMKTMDSQAIVPVAVKAIQELRADNAELRGMIERQQQQIDALVAGRPVPAAAAGSSVSAPRIGVGVGAGLGLLAIFGLGLGLVRRRRDDRNG
jgi:hypothetical protein